MTGKVAMLALVEGIVTVAWLYDRGRLRLWWDDWQARRNAALGEAAMSSTGKECPFCGDIIVCLGVGEHGEDLACLNPDCVTRLGDDDE